MNLKKKQRLDDVHRTAYLALCLEFLLCLKGGHESVSVGVCNSRLVPQSLRVPAWPFVTSQTGSTKTTDCRFYTFSSWLFLRLIPYKKPAADLSNFKSVSIKRLEVNSKRQTEHGFTFDLHIPTDSLSRYLFGEDF